MRWQLQLCVVLSLATRSYSVRGVEKFRQSREEQEENDHVRCVVDLVRGHLADTSQLTVLGPAPLPLWLDTVAAAVRLPLQVLPVSANTTKKAVRFHELTDAALVIVAGKWLVWRTLDRVLGLLPFNPRQRVVLWTRATDSSPSSLDDLATAFVQAAWINHMVRVVVLVSTESNGPRNGLCSTFYPIPKEPKSGMCHARTSVGHPLCAWTPPAAAPCLRRAFSPMHWLDLRGCTLRVAISVEAPFAMYSRRHGTAKGVAGRLLHEWARFSNFTPQFNQRRRCRNATGKPLGALGDIGDLIRRRQDVVIGAFFLTLDREETLTHVRTFSNVHYEWAVPASLNKGAGLGNLLNELSWDLWLSVLLALLLVAAFCRALWRRRDGPLSEATATPFRLQDCFKGGGHGLSMSQASATLFAVMLSVPVPRRLKRGSNASLRFVFGSWVLFSLVLRAAYESVLLTQLSLPISDLNIHSLEELATFNLPLVTSPSVLHYAGLEPEANDTQGALAAVLRRAITTDKDVMAAALDGMAVNRSVSALWTHEATMHALQKLERRYRAKPGKDNDYSLHSFGRLLSLPATYMLFPKGSSLVLLADHVQERMLVSGVLGHWMEELTDVKRWRALRGRPSQRAALTLQQMQPIFFLLALGQAVASATLLAEVWGANGAAGSAWLRRWWHAGLTRTVKNVLGLSEETMLHTVKNV